MPPTPISDAEKDQLPVVLTGKTGDYAMALFQKAFSVGGEKTASTFEKELNVLTWSVRGDIAWEAETQSPFFNQDYKRVAVRKKCTELGCSPFFAERIVEILDKAEEDLARLEQICADYSEIMRLLRKERDVTLVTPVQLSPEELGFYEKSIRASYLTPADVIVFDHKVDKNIIGLKIFIDRTEIDLTWNPQIKKHQEELAIASKKKVLKEQEEKIALNSNPDDFAIVNREMLKNFDWNVWPKDLVQKQYDTWEKTVHLNRTFLFDVGALYGPYLNGTVPTPAEAPEIAIKNFLKDTTSAPAHASSH